MALVVLIIGVLMIATGLLLTAGVLRRGEDPERGNRYSVGMVMVGLGCVLVMGPLLTVW